MLAFAEAFAKGGVTIKKETNIASLFAYLPDELREIVARAPEKLLEQADEIRVREGRPLSLTCGMRNVALDAEGKPCEASAAYCASRSAVADCVSRVAQRSLYAFDETVRHGYIPLQDGARAGLCGEAVASGDGIRTFSWITSVVLRLPRFYPDLAENLCRWYEINGYGGALVFAPPGIGKTTYLKSAAFLLSSGRHPLRVGVADEKRELWTPEIYGMCDFVLSAGKAISLRLLTENLAPQCLICDEISPAEAGAVADAANSGTFLIASAHAGSLEEAMRRPFLREMRERGIFSVAVRLWLESDGVRKSEVVSF